MSDVSVRAPKRIYVERTGSAPKRETTIDERIEQVWQLTLACLGWTTEGDDEPRLRRAVVHVRRPGR